MPAMGRYFGTNGIREVVGATLTAPFVAEMVGAIARVHEGPGPAVVGTDGRTSSPALGRIASGVLSLAGRDVVELGVLPTPAIQYNVPRLRGRLGVILTASHNPPEFNGIKGIASDGLEFPPEVEAAVEAAYERHDAPGVPYDRVGRIQGDPRGGDRYLEGIRGQVDVEAIQRRRFRVVLDCGNGASVVTSPHLLGSLGTRYVTLNGTLDGMFPGHLSEPTEANLADLVSTVPAIRAELGVAHDGDADRAVFVDEKGRYVPGEKMLTLLAREAVREAGKGTVVTPVTSSDAVREVVESAGGKVLYTRVGSPVVARAMQAHAAVFGGEENGGLIFPRHQLARDGAMTLARVLEVLAREGVPLSQLIDALPSYTLVKRKVPCPVALRQPVLEELTSAMDRGDPGVEVSTLDGIKVISRSGWYLVRPSGTEPLYRVFAEARDRATAESLAEDAIAKLEAVIRRLSDRTA